MAEEEIEYGDDDFEEGDEFEFEEVEETEASVDIEFEEEEKDPTKLEEDFFIELEEDDDLTEFQKMLAHKQKQDFKTPNRLTKYEFASIIGFRAQQIAEGAPPFVNVGALTDPSAIAIKEMNEGVMPLQIERPLPSNKIGKFTYEIRTLNELINVNQFM